MYLFFLLSALAFKSRHQIQHQLACLGFKRVYKTEMYTVSCATSSLLPRRRATSSRRVGFGRCSPSTTSTTPRISLFPNPRGPLVSMSSRSGRIRKLLPQLYVCVFRQVKLILSPKQRAKPAASRTRTCTNAAVCIASGECPSRF